MKPTPDAAGLKLQSVFYFLVDIALKLDFCIVEARSKSRLGLET
jgi:hypothetical protein